MVPLAADGRAAVFSFRFISQYYSHSDSSRCIAQIIEGNLCGVLILICKISLILRRDKNKYLGFFFLFCAAAAK